MAVLKPVAAIALLLTAGCQQQEQGAASAPEYNPQDAGTVDHALCLLGFTAVPLRAVQPGHHLVEATINGESGNFVLDTGANLTVIEQSQAERFGLESGSGGLAGLGTSAIAPGGARAGLAGVESFTIGPVPIRQNRVATADLGQLLSTLSQVSGVEVAGLIGQDVLAEHRALIDVARPMLYLIEADSEPAPVAAEQCSDAAGTGSDESAP